MKVRHWIKENKLAAILLFIVAYFVFKNFFLTAKVGLNDLTQEISAPGAGRAGISTVEVGIPAPESAPQPEVEDRMVVKTSQISAVVENVSGTVDRVLTEVGNKGGYMVSSSISRPQEQPYAQVVVRVPVEQLEATMEYVNDLAVKVTSQNLQGRDVTDQYEDLEEKLRLLNQTRQKFENILVQATEVEDILQVQRELINIQDRIDSVRGRQEYLEKTAENAKLTIHLSSDELSLPYVPEDDVFRPKVIFTKAVRSLVRTLRGAGRIIIWLGVYSVILVPIIGIVIWYKRRTDSDN